MHPVVSALVNSPILWTVLNVAQGLTIIVLLYMAIIYPSSETGFYSWHPVKRVLFLIFFPYVLLFKFLTVRCHCGCCWRCQDDD